jgi:hypothetical protein
MPLIMPSFIVGLVKAKNHLSLLSRFVIDKNGNRVGESISVFNDLLIIKRNDDYYAVPLVHVEQHNDELRVRGVVHWERAKELAEGWKHV